MKGTSFFGLVLWYRRNFACFSLNFDSKQSNGGEDVGPTAPLPTLSISFLGLVVIIGWCAGDCEDDLRADNILEGEWKTERTRRGKELSPRS